MHVTYYTYRCQSPHHNEESNTSVVWILSVRCDGQEECYKGVDEEGCKKDKGYTSKVLSFLETGLTKYQTK